jgi:hypothetical protein
MTIDEIKKILGINTLDEAQQTLLTEKLETMIDVKARERAESIISEEKETLVEEYEVKFDSYKKDITSKFSSFVDSVLDEELEIPEKVMEFAKKGELYNDLIEEFKKRLAIDAGVLSEDVKSLLKEAKDEIIRLKEEVNELTSSNMELTEDAKEMAAQLYIQEKCKGLSEAKREKVIGLLGDLREKKDIDKKFEFVAEHVINEEDDEEEDKEKKDEEEKEEDKEKKDDEEDDEGKGKAVVDEIVKESITEETSPFEDIKKGWLKILKENKI